MNFIEQIFGVAPDRGDGSLELMLLGIIVVLLVSALALFQVRKPNVTSGMVLGDPEGQSSPRLCGSVLLGRPAFRNPRHGSVEVNLTGNAQTIELASPPLMSWIGNDRRPRV